MASGTRSQLRAAGVDPTSVREKRHQTILQCRKGEFKLRCSHEGDHEHPESLPPAPKGKFVELYEEGRLYYPTLDEQWPEIPQQLAPLRLERFKSSVVCPGRYIPIFPGICDYDVLKEIHLALLMEAVDVWRNVKPEEVKSVPLEAYERYAV